MPKQAWRLPASNGYCTALWRRAGFYSSKPAATFVWRKYEHNYRLEMIADCIRPWFCLKHIFRVLHWNCSIFTLHQSLGEEIKAGGGGYNLKLNLNPVNRSAVGTDTFLKSSTFCESRLGTFNVTCDYWGYMNAPIARQWRIKPKMYVRDNYSCNSSLVSWRGWLKVWNEEVTWLQLGWMFSYWCTLYMKMGFVLCLVSWISCKTAGDAEYLLLMSQSRAVLLRLFMVMELVGTDSE